MNMRTAPATWRMAALSHLASRELSVSLEEGDMAQWVEAAVRCGIADAPMKLGRMLPAGAGINRDDQAAFACFLCAAESGDAGAMNFLGGCHEAGIGTRSDKLLARAWYRRSAKGGDFRGAYNYATMIGAEGCIAGALHWFGRALLNAPAPDRDLMVTALLSLKIGAVRALAAHANQSAGCTSAMKSA